jgi:hypothetical protein
MHRPVWRIRFFIFHKGRIKVAIDSPRGKQAVAQRGMPADLSQIVEIRSRFTPATRAKAHRKQSSAIYFLNCPLLRQ